MNEKHRRDLVLPVPSAASVRGRKWTKTKMAASLFGALTALCLISHGPSPGPLSMVPMTPLAALPPLRPLPSSVCAQVPPLLPDHSLDSAAIYAAKPRIVEWHQDAIRIPTEVYDEMGAPGEDERWEIFADFHAYLETAYPLTHAVLKRTKVDTWGLVFEWEGTDKDLKPLLLTGHQDVVPVLKDTEYQWTHGPFSGDYDGTYIWGRGSMDDKSTLTSVLGAIELLLETGEFKPTRTVILALGHDEERGGMRGAPALRDWLLEKYGAGSMAMLVDEGGGIVPVWGRAFGMPGTAEKGKYDLNVTVSTRGGHSSVPPRHTGIGLAALLVAALERNPHPMQLKEESPVWGHLQCAARYGPEVPHDLRAAVRKAVGGSKKALKAIPDILFKYFAAPEPGLGNMAAALLGTTQATDMIAGGVKINALPEVVTAFVNHRLDVGSSIKELQARIWDTLLPVAAEVGVALEGFGRTFKPDNAAGTVYLGSPSWSEDLEPAPISPSSPDAPAWKLLAGTSRGVWASRQSVSTDGTLADLDEEDELVMSPFLLTGNTDTRRYWDLTPNIYRWTFISDGQGAHTVNERVSADDIVEYTRFITALILNVDADREL